MKTEKPEDEAERRRKVAEEKIWGKMIESVERARKEPVARSIAFRLFSLLKSVRHFEKVVKMTWDHTDPLTSKVPPYTKNQTNFLIRTYNDVIRDLRLHLEKRDSYVREFSTFEELDDPTIDEIAGVIYKMGTIILQIISYLIRWME